MRFQRNHFCHFFQLSKNTRKQSALARHKDDSHCLEKTDVIETKPYIIFKKLKRKREQVREPPAAGDS